MAWRVPDVGCNGYHHWAAVQRAAVMRGRVVLASKGVTAKDTACAGLSPAQQRRTLMAIVFAVTWFNSRAMAAHLPELLLATGATLTIAVGIAALVGPA